MRETTSRDHHPSFAPIIAKLVEQPSELVLRDAPRRTRGVGVLSFEESGTATYDNLSDLVRRAGVHCTTAAEWDALAPDVAAVVDRLATSLVLRALVMRYADLCRQKIVTWPQDVAVLGGGFGQVNATMSDLGPLLSDAGLPVPRIDNVDHSAVALSFAPTAGRVIARAQDTGLPSGRYGAVVIALPERLGNLDEVRAVYQEAHRLLKPGGVLLGNSHHQVYSPEFVAALAGGFDFPIAPNFYFSLGSGVADPLSPQISKKASMALSNTSCLIGVKRPGAWNPPPANHFGMNALVSAFDVAREIAQAARETGLGCLDDRRVAVGQRILLGLQTFGASDTQGASAFAWGAAIRYLRQLYLDHETGDHAEHRTTAVNVLTDRLRDRIDADLPTIPNTPGEPVREILLLGRRILDEVDRLLI